MSLGALVHFNNTVLNVVYETVEELNSLDNKHLLPRLYARSIKKKLIKKIDAMKDIPLTIDFLFDLSDFCNKTNLFDCIYRGGSYSSIDILPNGYLTIISNKRNNNIRVVYFHKEKGTNNLTRIVKDYRNGFISDYTTEFKDKYTLIIISTIQEEIYNRLVDYIKREVTK